jgi:hypothetical protein
MSKLDHNISLARRCIDYVNSLNIKSVNVPFRFGTYYKYSKYHRFVLGATRCETVGASDQVLNRRRLVLAILADGTKSKKQRRAAVKALMVQWGDNYFRAATQRFFDEITDRKDEERVRNCRRAMKTRHGNCGEKSSVCATWLLENRPGHEVILWVNGGTAYDHAWVVFDHNAPNWDGTIANLGSDAVVVDGWTGDYYQAKHPLRYWHGGGANPFQITVRHNILNASGNIKVGERVRRRDWTESFSPHFRLAYAEQGPSTYEPQGSYLLRTYMAKVLRSAKKDDGWDEARAIQAALADMGPDDDDFEFEDD